MIQNLENEAAIHTLLYFYFTFTDTAKQALDHAIRALISQLYHRSQPDVQKYLDTCFASHDNGKKQPSLDALRKTLDEMLQQAGEVWIVLDALDECPYKDRQREALLKWVYGLHARLKKVHLLVTSRPEHDIHSAITQWATSDSIIPLQSELVNKDICSYIQWEVRNREHLQRWEGHPKVQEEIESALIEKAGGMYDFQAKVYGVCN